MKKNQLILILIFIVLALTLLILFRLFYIKPDSQKDGIYNLSQSKERVGSFSTFRKIPLKESNQISLNTVDGYLTGYETFNGVNYALIDIVTQTKEIKKIKLYLGGNLNSNKTNLFQDGIPVLEEEFTLTSEGKGSNVGWVSNNVSFLNLQTKYKRNEDIIRFYLIDSTEEIQNNKLTYCQTKNYLCNYLEYITNYTYSSSYGDLTLNPSNLIIPYAIYYK